MDVSWSRHRDSLVASMLFATWLAVLGAPAPAHAQSVDSARRLYLDARFDQAAEAFEQILARPSLGAAEAAEAHCHLVALHTMMGDPDAAQRHAEAAVALDPAVAVPEGAPRQAEQLLAEARTKLGGRRATLEIEAAKRLQEGAEVEITATLDPAPAVLASQLHLLCISGTSTGEQRSSPPQVRVRVVPSDEAVYCRASARSAGGAALLSQRRDLPVGATADDETARETDAGSGGSGDLELVSGAGPGSQGRSRSERSAGSSALPWLVGAGSAVAVGVAIALGLVLAGRPPPNSATVGEIRIDGW